MKPRSLALALMAMLGFAGTLPLPGLLAQARTNAGPVVMPTNAPSTNAPADLAPSLPPISPVSPAPAPGVATNSSSSGVSPDEDIDDVRPPFFATNFWPWILLGLAILLALGALIWFLLHRRRPLSPLSAYELTLQKLEKARALLREDNPMPYAVLVSETIRSYLGQRFEAPSTRRTTEEFLRQMESDRATPLAEHRDLLKEFLQSCDLVKFARYQPTLAELEQVQQRAYSFVTATRPVETPGHQNGSRP